MRTFRREDDDIIMFLFAGKLCEHSFYFPMSISDQSHVVTLEGCKSWSIIKLSSGSSWGARPKHLSLVSSQPSLPCWTRLIFNGIQWTKFWSLEIHLKWGGGEQHDAFWYLALFFFSILVRIPSTICQMNQDETDFCYCFQHCPALLFVLIWIWWRLNIKLEK